MQIEKLSDAALHSQIKTLVAREREILTDVLKHLLEVDRRKLFSKFRYPSLFEYARQELGYSEDAAYRRIDAMRALREIPALEQKISSGKVTLSAINAARKIIRAERKVSTVSPARTLELFSAVENKSKREAEKTLQQITVAPRELIRPEKMREIGENLEIRFAANQKLQEKLAQVRAELSNANPNLSISELFEKLCDEFLEKAEKRKRVKVRDVAKAQLDPDEAPRKFAPARKHISSSVRRLVMQKANQKCEKCGSTWQLELDHRKPIALDGDHAMSNLRVLCRNCNQRAAIESLGTGKMRKFDEPRGDQDLSSRDRELAYD